MNYRVYFAMEKRLKAQGHHVDRKDLILQFTAGKKDSLKALSAVEYSKFINWLQHDKVEPLQKDWKNSPANKMRRKVYSLFVSKMCYTPEQLDAWCVKYSHAHKPLQQHSAAELVTLVSQAEQVYDSFVLGIDKKTQVNESK